MKKITLAILGLALVTAATWAGWVPPVNLGSGINSAYADVDPGAGAGDISLYFASNRAGGFGGYDLFVSNKAGGVWQPAGNLGGIVNSSSNENGPAYTTLTATAIYFHSNRPGGQGNNDIWRTIYSGSAWQAPVIQTPLNSSSDDIDPHICGSPTRCFFSSNRAGGFGGYDLWYSAYSGSTWTTPVNLGAGVNTAYNEMGPTADVDAQNIYFYSNRPGGNGGYDLYWARAVGPTWGNVQNLNDPPNTAWFEGMPGRATDSITLFFVSDRSGGFGGYDIYFTEADNPGVEPASLGRVKTLFR